MIGITAVQESPFMKHLKLFTGTLVAALLSAGITAAASDYSLAGAGSDESPTGSASSSQDSSSDTDSSQSSSQETSSQSYSGGINPNREFGNNPPPPGTYVGDGNDILPDDEMITVLGSESILTNELVADEYNWVKTEMAGRFMPYVIEHAEGNPNVIHFLYLYGHDVTSPETFEYTDNERNCLLPHLGENVTGLVPLLMQWDWRWGFEYYGGGPRGLTGCAPTCMAMIGFGLTKDESINPRDMSIYSENAGYWVSGKGTSWTLVTTAFPNHPISCSQISVDEATIASELRAGHPVLINVGIGKFSAVGHFMVLAGITDDGNFILNDPNNLENSSKTWPWSELSSEVVNAWSYTLTQ